MSDVRPLFRTLILQKRMAINSVCLTEQVPSLLEMFSSFLFCQNDSIKAAAGIAFGRREDTKDNEQTTK